MLLTCARVLSLFCFVLLFYFLIFLALQMLLLNLKVAEEMNWEQCWQRVQRRLITISLPLIQSHCASYLESSAGCYILMLWYDKVLLSIFCKMSARGFMYLPFTPVWCLLLFKSSFLKLLIFYCKLIKAELLLLKKLFSKVNA